MTRLLTIALVLVCGCKKQPAPSKATTTPPDAPQPTVTKEVTAPPDASQLPAAWDPQTPLKDLDDLPHRRLFAIKKTALCPTTAGADQRECGNSVEFADKGYIVRKGQGVTVVGNAPTGKHWRGVRYMKTGLMPGWVLAEDLAARPDMTVVKQMRQRVARNLNGADLPTKTLAKATGKSVRFGIRGDAVRFGTLEGDTVTLYVQTKAGDYVAVAFRGIHTQYAVFHTCLLYGDCLELNYECEEGFCDDVVLTATPTGKSTTPPDDPEDEWDAPPAAMPLLQGHKLADRYGTFTAK